MTEQLDFTTGTPPSANEAVLQERISRLEQQLEDTVLLLSDVYRYGKLRELLSAGQWKEADLETTRVMVEITGKKSQDEIAPEDMQTFPCSAIRVLDALWKKYSHGRFGFSVQLHLYLSLGGNLDAIRAQENEFLRLASESIGWRKQGQQIDYDDRDFSLAAPEGSLPADWWRSSYGAKMANFFLARSIGCEL